jgi:2OG-Fe(II) oxygenase superfamily
VTTAIPVRAPYLVIDDFMPSTVALDMRNAAEAHLGNPYRHSLSTHMDWDYWHVPGLYTYLRTQPAKVLGAQLAGMFHERLSGWTAERLGLLPNRDCYLSLYVSGCRQSQHNDAANGRFGYVYSLTKNERRTTGGETLIWNEENYFETRMHRPSWGSAFFQAVEPRFNRLLVFDDRMPHSVQLVEGNMDPLEGRLVIHGHIREAGPLVSGPLPREALLTAAEQLASAYSTDLGSAARTYHGPATVRFTVQSDGSVAGASLILDRVRRLGGRGPSVDEMLAGLVARVAHLEFEPSSAETTIILPFGFG